MTDKVISELSRRFDHFARHIYGNSAVLTASPLYAHLSAHIKDDPALLALMTGAEMTTTVTNLYFASVQYLLLGGHQHVLREYYPNLSPEPRPITESYPAFREFCLIHADEIRAIVATHLVQTNEVRRCACMLPAFGLISARTRESLALLEVGTSAGLHLNWDRYYYDYGIAQVGDTASPVHITCAVKGNHEPPIPNQMPSISYRAGIDPYPIDVHDEAATRWLRALVWPEHVDRQILLESALVVTRAHTPTMIRGSAADMLFDVALQVPADWVLCIFHSYTLNQMPATVRSTILEQIASVARQRPVYHISQEWYDGQDQPNLTLTAQHESNQQARTLANCESHGRWIEWRDD